MNKNRYIKFAALDVFNNEPTINLSRKIRLLPNVISTCHSSFYDEETQSMQDWEEYTFVLTLDNLAEMYDINTPPISDFTYAVTGQGIPPEGSPPMANFTWNSNSFWFYFLIFFLFT